MSVTPHRALTPLALAVLELLLERAMHPYEMHQLIRDRRIDHVIKLRAGSLYHTVERLHRLDLIEPVETARAGRRPERTVYAITEQGRDAFAARMRDLIQRPEPEYLVAGGTRWVSPQDMGIHAVTIGLLSDGTLAVTFIAIATDTNGNPLYDAQSVLLGVGGGTSRHWIQVRLVPFQR